MKFIQIDEVLVIHDRMISVGGGKSGIRDFTMLHSAIERSKIQFAGKYLYKNIWLMAAATMQSLIKNHPFYDGNKRTAYFSTVRFFNNNGFILNPGKKDIVEYTVSIDTKNRSVEEISIWLKENSKRRRQ